MPAPPCVVEGTINPRTGTGGRPFGIGFELRLPEAWNGRLLSQGGGGLDGVLNEVVGAIPVAGATAPPALNRGYAVVSTASGHRGTSSRDASFGLDQQARLHFAYAAIGEVSREARALVAARYGRDPARAYYMGCSNGGRTAMMAAQRFPTLAALPHPVRRRGGGQPRLPPEPGRHRPSLGRGRLRPRGPARRRRRTGSRRRPVGRQPVGRRPAPGRRCRAVRPRCQNGKLSRPGPSRGPEPSLGRRPGRSGACPVRRLALGRGHRRPGLACLEARDGTRPPRSTRCRPRPCWALYFMTPPPQTSIWRPWISTASPNKPRKRRRSTTPSSFAARGGKLLVYRGNSDPVFSAEDLRAHWRELARDNRGADALDQWARLFVVPGMTHRGGGFALDDFDPLATVEAWVERGDAPAYLIAGGRLSPATADRSAHTRRKPVTPLAIRKMRAHSCAACRSREGRGGSRRRSLALAP